MEADGGNRNKTLNVFPLAPPPVVPDGVPTRRSFAAAVQTGGSQERRGNQDGGRQDPEEPGGGHVSPGGETAEIKDSSITKAHTYTYIHTHTHTHVW